VRNTGLNLVEVVIIPIELGPEMDLRPTLSSSATVCHGSKLAVLFTRTGN